MATQLAIVKIDGKLYYEDLRLREYRAVTDFLGRIAFDDLGERKTERVTPKKILTPRKTKLR